VIPGDINKPLRDFVRINFNSYAEVSQATRGLLDPATLSRLIRKRRQPSDRDVATLRDLLPRDVFDEVLKATAN
jgi:hypothetical protein